MIYKIKNKYLKVEINSKGGQIWSIKDNDNSEYIWQGHKQYWEERAINIFPYVARLTDEKYIYKGKEYRMDIHGFLKDFELEINKEKTDNNKITFVLKYNKQTIKQYPFVFCLEIEYKLEKNKLNIKYSIKNRDLIEMYFAIGGHPGFNIPIGIDVLNVKGPLEKKELMGKFQKHYLEFSTESDPKCIEMSKDCFITGERHNCCLIDNKVLELQHELFDNDAIILENMSNEVFIKNNYSNKTIKIGYPNMKYLGIWHQSKTDAPYVCIEPWTSLPSRKGVVEDLELQEDLIKLDAGEKYTNTWWIEIENQNII